MGIYRQQLDQRSTSEVQATEKHFAWIQEACYKRKRVTYLSVLSGYYDCYGTASIASTAGMFIPILSYKSTLTLILQVTIFLPSHERQPDQTISTVYEYTLKASQTYLQKFDQPYNIFESDLIIHRRIIPLQKETFELLSQAVRRAAGSQADHEKVTGAVEEDAISIIPLPVDSNKRKVLDISDINIPSKRIKSKSG